MKYTFINANTDLGVHINGTDKGPKLITKYFNKYEIIDVNKDNIEKEHDKENKTKNIESVNKFNYNLYQVVTDTIKKGNFPITVGGDHSLAIGSALASNTQNNDIGIIWIDAHADYNTIESTLTGNIHGLPLAVINGHDKKEFTGLFEPTPEYIKHSRTVIVGARDIDELELENLKKDNITVYTTEDVHKFGVKEIMNKAFLQAMGDNNKVHISYDIDVIDPKVCPGVSTAVPDGITLDECYDIMKFLKEKKKNIKSLDLVEYNPDNDKNNKSLDIATNLINIFLNDNN